MSIACGRVTARHGAASDRPDTIPVDDAPNDINAAQDSGVRAVAGATGNTRAEEHIKAGADALLTDMRNTDAALKPF